MFKKGKGEPADYCLVDAGPEHRLSQFERLTLIGGRELERALGWLGKQFTEIGYHQRLEPVDPEAAKAAAAFYGRPEWLKKPNLFFEPPPLPKNVAVMPVHGLQGGEIIDLEFLSAYQPKHLSFTETYKQERENQTVHARVWRHQSNARGLVIGIHGFTMGDQRLNSLALMPGLFFRLGLDVALIELPYHGRRRSTAETDAGKFLFPSSDFVRTNEALGQVISDLRSLRLYLSQGREVEVGCVGLSLGAYVAALWSGLDKLSFAVPIVPLVSMSEIAWDILSKTEDLKRLRSGGVTPELLHQIYALHSPLSYPAQFPPERALILAGLGDHLVPARQPKLLWDHWKRPKIVWMQGGHGAQLKRERGFEEMISFLRGLDLI